MHRVLYLDTASAARCDRRRRSPARDLAAEAAIAIEIARLVIYFLV